MNEVCIANANGKLLANLGEEISNLNILLASISAIVLFLYGLDEFSKEIQREFGDGIGRTFHAAAIPSTT
jgi:hypothetical protein